VTVFVITVSDRAARGEYTDLSGPEIERGLKALFPAVEVTRSLVPDDPDKVMEALHAGRRADLILTTGGTGLSPRDITPEVTRRFCEKEVPGIAEILRARSLAETPTAVLSRGIAGVRGTTLVVNFPGSPAAVKLCLQVLAPVVEHAIHTLRAEGH